MALAPTDIVVMLLGFIVGFIDIAILIGFITILITFRAEQKEMLKDNKEVSIKVEELQKRLIELDNIKQEKIYFPEQGNPITIRELAKQMGVSVQTISEMDSSSIQ